MAVGNAAVGGPLAVIDRRDDGHAPAVEPASAARLRFSSGVSTNRPTITGFSRS